MRNILITGHGNYATGIKNSLELLSGEHEDIIAVDFKEDMDENTLKRKMRATIQSFEDSDFLVLCDILGGTPFKAAAELANKNEKIEVVVGCNVGAILEYLFDKNSMSLSKLANSIVETSKQYTVKFEKI